jgi:Divergent InlB B-repeat domain
MPDQTPVYKKSVDLIPWILLGGIAVGGFALYEMLKGHAVSGKFMLMDSTTSTILHGTVTPPGHVWGLINSASLVVLHGPSTPPGAVWGLLASVVSYQRVKLINTTTLNVGIFPTTGGWAEVDINGVAQAVAPSYDIPSPAQVTLIAYANVGYVFDYWSADGQRVDNNPNTTVTLSGSGTLSYLANFKVSNPPPPPPSNPVFPAPGTVGDGDVWFWVGFLDGTYGWNDFNEVYGSNPNSEIDFTLPVLGPYASGATS